MILKQLREIKVKLEKRGIRRNSKTFSESLTYKEWAVGSVINKWLNYYIDFSIFLTGELWNEKRDQIH